jgi:hypothetical protein
MSNANGRQILEEAKAMEHGEVACGLAIAAEALSIELKRVKQQRAELLEALKECVEFYSYAEFGSIAKAREAITKAEAAE